MEKNFPFIKIGWFDRMYDRLVLSLTRKLDNGQIFKTIIVSLLHLLSFAFLFGGIIFCVAALFGDAGYISALDMYPGGKKVLAIIGLILGLPVGLFMSWFLYSLVRKRGQQLGNNEYGSILTFIFESAAPSLIILVGELAAALAIMSAVLQLFGTLLNSMAYAPIMKLVGFLNGANLEYVQPFFRGSYDFIGANLGMDGATGFLVGGVLILIGAYVLRDVYKYLYTLALRLLNPVLYFAVAGILGLVITGAFFFFMDGSDVEAFGWVALVFISLLLIYTLLMLLKKYVYVNKSNN
jgi:hypothetical protein